MDDMTQPNFAACKAAAVVPDPATGEERTYVAQYALDLRDGSERGDSLSEGMLRSKREHIGALADTGAKLRVIREATGIRMDMSQQEISQYFAVVTTTEKRTSPDEQIESAAEASDDLYSEPAELGGAEEDDQVSDQDASSSDVIDADFEDSGGHGRDWPDPDDWSGLEEVDRIGWLSAAVEDADGFDLDAKLSGTSHEGSAVGDLPESWQRKLYVRLYDDHLNTVDHDDLDDLEDPPF
jgi:hypothetical protein